MAKTATSPELPEFPDRPGYVLVGFTRSYWHKRAGRRIYAKPGKAFPLWRKLE